MAQPVTAARRPRIGLFGPYASRNLGDIATQMAALQELGRRRPDAQFVGLSHAPDDTLHTLGLPAFPISGRGVTAGDLGRFRDLNRPPVPDGRPPWAPKVIRRISRLVRTLDLFVISGGGQLDDFWGGPWAHPWSMLLWTAMARWHRVPVACLAVGVDCLETRLGRFFTLEALGRAQHRSFRDPDSAATLARIGLRSPSTVCPDLVFALDTNPADRLPAPRPFAVLSPISRQTWSHTESRLHDHYLDALAASGRLIARAGFDIRITCSQTGMDVADATRLYNLLSQDSAVTATVHDSPTVTDFLRTVRGAELVIASRLHGVVLSLLAGSPVLAVKHLPKVGEVMKSFGMESLCLDLQSLDGAHLDAAVRDALAHTDSLRTGIEATNRHLRAELAAPFDEVASLLSTR